MPDATLAAIERGEKISLRLSSFGTRVVDGKVLITVGMEPDLWILLASLLQREGSDHAKSLVAALVSGFEFLAEADEEDDDSSEA